MQVKSIFTPTKSQSVQSSSVQQRYSGRCRLPAREHAVGGDDKLGAGDILDAEVGNEATAVVRAPTRKQSAHLSTK